jgi:hypothetical protein
MGTLGFGGAEGTPTAGFELLGTEGGVYLFEES